MEMDAATLLGYWHRSLADADLLELEVKQDTQLVFTDGANLQEGALDPDAQKRAWERAGAEAKIGSDDDDHRQLNVFVAPLVLRAETRGGRRDHESGQPRLPIVVPARLQRDGRLQPHPENGAFIARQFLEPMPGNAPTIASLAHYDQARSQFDEVRGDNWHDHLDAAYRLLRRTLAAAGLAASQTAEDRETANCLQQSLPAGWLVLDEPAVLPASDLIQPGHHLRALAQEAASADERLTTTALQPLVDSGAKRGIRHERGRSRNQSHLGQMSGDFPLAELQREALVHYTETAAGELLAVDGPPGTGKTTLIQSVVAHLMVDRARRGGDPPLIFATSANNQAVTNIIDAFGDTANHDTALAQRWLPELSSFGLYLPSASKQASEAYQVAGMTGWQWSGFIAAKHNRDYIVKAEEAFVNACQAHNGATTVDDAVEALQQELSTECAEIERCQQLAHELIEARSSLPGGALEAARAELQRRREARWDVEARYDDRIQDLEQHRQQATARVEAIRDSYTEASPLLARGPIAALLRLMPRRRARCWRQVQDRLRNASGVELSNTAFDRLEVPKPSELRRAFSSLYNEATRTVGELGQRLENERHQRQQDVESRQQEEKQLTAAIQQAERLEGALMHSVDSLLELPGGRIHPDGVEITNEPHRIEELLDVKRRHRAFLLAIHYWEGRFLQAVKTEVLTANKPGAVVNGAKAEARRATLRRTAMLAPCMVATAYMMPRWLSYRPSPEHQVTHYMLGEADLLICDEAGQASPEVAGPPFALAATGLIVGDIWQIEPVHDLPVTVDEANLAQCGLTRDTDAGKVIRRYGLKASPATDRDSGGNLMVAAHRATAWSRDHPDHQPRAAGLFLEVHRRCPDAIIGFCNELVYGPAGQPLVPARGNAVDGGLPFFGFADVRGHVKEQAGSLVNTEEAQAIADWLATNRQSLEHIYGGSGSDRLEDLVAVVTPYRPQKHALMRALKKQDIQLNRARSQPGKATPMTVGTIHALQGAARPIVIFSPTITGEVNRRAFFDRQANLLNVAVSRTQRSFIVIGDMRCFQRGSSDYSSVLAQHLEEPIEPKPHCSAS